MGAAMLKAGCLAVLTVVILCGQVCLVPAAAAPTPPAEAALETLVDLELPNATIGEALAALSKQTGVSLMAPLPLSAQRLAVVIRQQPLRLVMDDLGQMFGYQWQCGGGIYLLTYASATALPQWGSLAPEQKAQAFSDWATQFMSSLSATQVAKTNAEGLSFGELNPSQKVMLASFLEGMGHTTFTDPEGRTYNFPLERWKITEAQLGPYGWKMNVRAVLQPGEQGNVGPFTNEVGISITVRGQGHPNIDPRYEDREE